MSKNKIVLQFDIDEVPDLKDQIRNRLLDAITSITRDEINSQFNRIFDKKIDDKFNQYKIDDYLRSYISSMLHDKYNNFNRLLRDIVESELNKKITEYLATENYTTLVNKRIAVVVGENIEQYIQDALRKAFRENLK